MHSGQKAVKHYATKILTTVFSCRSSKEPLHSGAFWPVGAHIGGNQLSDLYQNLTYSGTIEPILMAYDQILSLMLYFLD